MKIAIIGSRTLSVDDLGQYLPKNTTEIISGGAKEYAQKNNISFTEFLPDYYKYSKARNSLAHCFGLCFFIIYICTDFSEKSA
ncbi:MAG: hypothetical protein IJ192_09400 [Clostridia bacterium]|nr:hypothetical protein [Clostridia bacterium]